MKIFDCSINNISNNLHNVNSLGPLENDIMSDLRKYSSKFNVEFVDDYKKCDVIITNTIYPDKVLDYSIKNNITKVKRMDGIFSINELEHRNTPLNIAAQQSDKVIFISEYSRQSYYTLYGDKLKSDCVILNDVDDNIFKPLNMKKHTFMLCSSATNWSRKEKRLKSVVALAKRINEKIILIGRCDENYDKINVALNLSNVFLSLFFRCAGSKVTTQAIRSGLPILYTSSGGLPELVNTGVIINDYDSINFLDSIPDLNDDEVYDKYLHLKENYGYYRNVIKPKDSYLKMIEKYFIEISNTK